MQAKYLLFLVKIKCIFIKTDQRKSELNELHYLNFIGAKGLQ